MIKKLLFAALLVGGLTAVPRPANALFAILDHYFPGTECVKKTGSLTITTDAAVYNPSSSSSATVQCPLTSALGTSTAATLTYVDESPLIMTCVSRCDSPVDETSSVSLATLTTSNDHNVHTMTFGSITPSAFGSYCHIDCTIPNNSSGNIYIVGYQSK